VDASAADLIRAVETHFRDLLEAAPDAVVIVDADGRMLLVNRQTESLFGYARAELLGQPVEAAIPGRFRSGHGEKRSTHARDARVRPMGAGLEPLRPAQGRQRIPDRD
jgi:PAS domain S-box-containing protein